MGSVKFSTTGGKAKAGPPKSFSGDKAGCCRCVDALLKVGADFQAYLASHDITGGSISRTVSGEVTRDDGGTSKITAEFTGLDQAASDQLDQLCSGCCSTAGLK